MTIRRVLMKPTPNLSVVDRHDLLRSRDRWLSLHHSRRLRFEQLEERRLLAPIPGYNLSTGTHQTSYTLAIATTAEFTQSAAGKAATQTLLGKYVDELNKVFERELAISFRLHPQNEKLVFENPASDGYTNGNVGLMRLENPGVINQALNGDPANDSGYDLGHVLGIGTDGGQGSWPGKALGASDVRENVITNFPYIVELVAHEVGHQLSASHTYNGLANLCGNRNTAAFEPGSGGSIMSYQGVCGSDDLPTFPGDKQNFGDIHYFHASSFDEIISYTTREIPHLGVKTPTENALPILNAGVDRTIPASTPFTLTATASDNDTADMLTFSWDQIDTGGPIAIILQGAPLTVNGSPAATTNTLNQLDQTAVPYVDGDKILITGTNLDGISFNWAYTYRVGDALKDLLLGKFVGDSIANSILDANNFRMVNASLSADGRIRVEAIKAGAASLSLTLQSDPNDAQAASGITTFGAFNLLVDGRNDPGAVNVPIPDSQDRLGPLFRSFAPTTSPSRTFPQLADILANTPPNQNKNEHLPTNDRVLNFRATVHDNHVFNGRTISGVVSDDIQLTVINTGASFKVTSLNTGNQTVIGGSSPTITWDVVGTTTNGINTSHVDILLSVDGGLTYPINLATRTENDGSQQVLIPNVNAAKARLKVQADPAQNIFFDVNDADFRVEASALTVNVLAASVSENAGPAATTVTITRNTDTTNALLVNLSSSDATEATVPTTATIPAGQTSVSVNFDAVDDAIVDGKQTITITASATGFMSGSDTVDVTDNDNGNPPLAADLQITDAFLRDYTGAKSNSAPIGEQFEAVATWTTRNLASDAKYDVHFRVNGYEVTIPAVTQGAGQATFSGLLTKLGWYAFEGVNVVEVQLDPSNAVAETDETNNSFSFQFTAAIPTAPMLLLWPLSEKLFTTYAISNYYDVDPSPIKEDYLNRWMSVDGHIGWDINPNSFFDADNGLPIVAAADGIVTWVGDGYFDRELVPMGQPSNGVLVDHGNGWQTIYGHMRRDSVVVRVGQEVRAGDILGLLGSSGNSGGAHLHFDIRHNGRAVDPMLGREYYLAPTVEDRFSRFSVVSSQISNRPLTVDLFEANSETRSFDTTAGQTLAVGIFVAGHAAGIPLNVAVFKPSGSLWVEHDIVDSRDIGSGIWTPHWILPDSPDIGRWRIEFSANDKSLGEEFFEIASDGGLPELRVLHQGSIASASRWTPYEFVSTEKGSSRPTLSFSIENHGTAPLNVSGIEVPTWVRIDKAPSSNIAPGQSSVLEVSAETSDAGTHWGQVAIYTDDKSEERSTFQVQSLITESAADATRVGLATQYGTEGQTVLAKVYRSGAVNQPLTVNLSTTSLNDVTVPSSVTIPANQAWVDFEFNVVEDFAKELLERISIIATPQGNYLSSKSEFLVIDNDEIDSRIQLSFSSASVSENNGTLTGTVVRQGDLREPLLVHLFSSNPDAARVPMTVIIPAGKASTVFSLLGINDTLIDGNLDVEITASVFGVASAVSVIEVIDNDIAMLAVALTASTVAENAGAAATTVTVSRNTDTSNALVVNLSSSDVTEATVPTTATIPAGQTSITVNLDAVDDALVDGTQTVTITASATGLSNGTDTVNVTDNEIPALTVNVVAAAVAENAGPAATTVTISRNTDTANAQVVNLSSSDVTEALVPTTATIPAGQTSVTVNLDAVDEALVDGTQTITITASVNGFNSGSDTVNVTDDESPTLTVSVDAEAVAENGGASATNVKITRNTDTANALTINLISSDTTEATVPATTTIAAGQTSVTVNLATVDDTVVDGSQTITITASAAGFGSGTDTVYVTDNDTPTLTVNIAAASVAENAGTLATTVTVSRNTDTVNALVVDLTSSDETEATVSTTATLAAGQASVTVNLAAVDDPEVDGWQTVTIMASSAGFTSGSDIVNVTDNDTAKLTVNVAAMTIAENAGSAATTITITRNTDSTNALVVNLTSSDTTEATISATATIAAGQRSVTVPLDAIDDTLLDGTQTVTITATAAGYASGFSPLLITDVNKAPTADSQTLTTNEDTQLAISLNGGDGDDGGNQRLTFVITTLPAHGSLSVVAGGAVMVATDLPKSLSGNTLFFTPNSNSTLSSTFRFLVQDDGGTADGGLDTSQESSVIVDVTPVNDVPTVDELQDAFIDEDAVLQSIDLAGITAGGSESQAITVTALSSDPSLIPQPTIRYSSPDTNGTLQFAAVANQNGTAVITVFVKDGGIDGILGNSDDESIARSFTITVTPKNDPPIWAHPGNTTLDEKTAVTFILNATDLDVADGIADTVSYSIVAGSLTGMTLNGSSGSFGWTPTETQDGEHIIVFRAQDIHGLAGIDQTITITVNEVNDPPVLANPGDKSINALEPLDFLLTATETDTIGGVSDATSYSIVIGEQPGMTLHASTGEFAWTPNASQSAVFFVTFRATDIRGLTHDQSIAITVRALNQPPTEIKLSRIPNLPFKENVTGAFAGKLSAIDPDPGQTHIFATADIRFEIIDNNLKLIDDQFVTGQSVTVDVLATDSGSPSRSITSSMVIEIEANPRAWKNTANPLDANADDRVVPLDALAIINQLNGPTILGPGGRLPNSRLASSTLPYYDTNGDGFCTPNDVLQIVNFLNNQQAEGEADEFNQPPSISFLFGISQGISIPADSKPRRTDALLQRSQPSSHETEKKIISSVPTIDQPKRRAENERTLDSVLDSILDDIVRDAILAHLDHPESC